MTSEQLTTADLANAANGREIPVVDEGQHATPLLPGDFSEEMRSRWETIQTAFVDDPRVSVQHADELVATAIKRLAETFAEERAKLEQQWSKGERCVHRRSAAGIAQISRVFPTATHRITC